MKEYWLLVLGYNLNLLFGLSLGEIVLNQIFSRKFFVVITKIMINQVFSEGDGTSYQASKNS